MLDPSIFATCLVFTGYLRDRQKMKFTSHGNAIPASIGIDTYILCITTRLIIWSIAYSTYKKMKCESGRSIDETNIESNGLNVNNSNSASERRVTFLRMISLPTYSTVLADETPPPKFDEVAFPL